MIPKIVRRQPQADLSGSDLPPLLQRIYSARGVTDTQELDRSLKVLTPYARMKGVDQGVALIAEAVTQGQRILIVGDFDCDGATSSTVAVLALRAMGAAWVDFLVPNRFEYGYGLSPEIVKVAAEMQPDLLITVDNGISSIEGVQAAKAQGMQVVVTDHHLAGAQLPDADAIINPNQPGCDFPSKSLCGVGVIFYVMSALRRELEQRGWFAEQNIKVPNMAEYLDLVALGTVADVVSLDHNNRILVEQGLRRIRARRARPGILALLEVAGREPEQLASMDLGFVVGPRLNAAGRLDDMSIGIECLMTEDPQTAKAMALQLNELNQDRKQIEQSMQQQALGALDAMALADDADMPAGVCLFDESWHEGVIGILASRIKDRFHRPVIAFAPSDNGMLKGSARSIEGLHIRDALDAVAARHPELLSKFGGHAMAAGMSIEPQHYEAFAAAFDAEARRQLREEDFQACLETDGELSPAEFQMSIAEMIQQAGPWGQHFPEPLFDGEFNVIQQRIVGERHLKLVLGVPDSSLVVDGIAFNVDLKVWPNEAQQARVVYRLDINEYRGRRSLQLMVRYIEPLAL